MPIEGATVEPTPAENPFAAYDAIGTAPPPAEDPGLGAYDAIGAPETALPPPDVTSTSDTADFSAYDAIQNKGVERTAAEIFGLPTPTPTPTPPPGVDLSVYDSIGATPKADQALDSTPAPVPAPREEIRAPTLEDQPALLLEKIARTTDKLFAPGESSAPIVSPEVAAVGVKLFSGGARTAAKMLENLTGKPYQAAEQGVEQALSEGISGLTVPEQIAGLLQFAVPGVAETYAVNVVSKLPEQYGRLKEAIEKYGLVSAETAKAATEAGITDLFGFLAAKGAQVRNANLLKPKGGEPDALSIGSATPEVPRTAEAGQNISGQGEGIRPSEQRVEATRTLQAEAPPQVAYSSPEFEAWAKERDRLRSAYDATQAHTPERAAARKAIRDHADTKPRGYEYDPNDPLALVQNTATQYDTLGQGPLRGAVWESDWFTAEDGRTLRKVKTPDGHVSFVDRNTLRPHELEAIDGNSAAAGEAPQVISQPAGEQGVKTETGTAVPQGSAVLPVLREGETQGVLPEGDIKTEAQLASERAAEEERLSALQQAQDVRVGSAKPLRAGEDIRSEADMFVPEQQPDIFDQKKETTAERLARQKAEDEMRAEMEAELAGTRSGPELLDAISESGGLPSPASNAAPELKGEIANLRETAMGGAGAKGTFLGKLFKKSAPHPDTLVSRLRDQGFDFETPSDLFEALDMRLRTGRPHYGIERSIADQYALEGFGPGAAVASEPLPKYKERSFATRLQADEALLQELKDAAGNRYYEPISNKVTADQANAVIKERGIAQSINLIQDRGNGLDYRTRSAIGQIIVKRLNEGARGLREKSPADAALLLNRAADVAEWAAQYGTELGQGVQSFAMWNRLGPDGQLLSVQRMIRKTRDRFTQENGDQVTKIVEAANTHRIEALRELAKTSKVARKLKSKFQDLIDASQPQLLTEDTFYQIAGDRLGLPKFDAKVAADISRLAEAIDAAPEGIPHEKATLELNRYVANMKGFDPRDVLFGIYYGNMLSGYNTQIVNALDTFLNVTSETTGLALANPRAAARIYEGLVRGLNQGRTDALLALTEGRMATAGKYLEVPKLMEIARFGEKGGVPIRTDTAFGRAVKRISESPVAYPVRGWKYVGRLMQASDSIMFRGAEEARAALLADRTARAEGLHGQALSNRVDELLGLTKRDAFKDQAEAEGFTGAAAKARADELSRMVRSEEAQADASDFAGEATYNHNPHGMLGFFADGVAKWSKEYPGLKLFVPFTRIVANVTNRGLNYTPYGFKRAFYGYSREGPPVGDAQAALIARAAMGTAALTTLMAMQHGDLLQIHGAGPSDNERRKQLQNAGWKPYSIQIGNHYFSYVYTPFGLGLSIAGNWSDVDRYAELGKQDATTRLIYTVSRIGSTIFSQSFLSGLSGLFRWASGSPGDVISSWKQFVSSTVGTFTTPTILRDMQRLWDPTIYKSDSIMGDVLRNTPFASAANKPVLNAFGEPAQRQTNRFLSTLSDDPAWRFVVEKGLRVPVPGKTTTVPDGQGGKRRMTPEEYYDYLRESGQQVKALIVERMSDWATMDSLEVQDQLSSESEKIRKRVKEGQFR